MVQFAFFYIGFLFFSSFKFVKFYSPAIDTTENFVFNDKAGQRKCYGNFIYQHTRFYTWPIGKFARFIENEEYRFLFRVS